MICPKCGRDSYTPQNPPVTKRVAGHFMGDFMDTDAKTVIDYGWCDYCGEDRR